MKTKTKTQTLWDKQNKNKGDRWRLFQSVCAVVPATNVLYAGSYVDLAPSFVFSDVTYVDMDKRAAAFFADRDGVRQIIAEHDGDADVCFRFIHSDYSKIELQPRSFDLLISLYAGFISEACGHLLRVGGTLLVNPSHGDAALAALHANFKLVTVVTTAEQGYQISSENLERYMIPKKAQEITADSIKAWGKAIAYTESPFAYLMQRIE